MEKETLGDLEVHRCLRAILISDVTKFSTAVSQNEEAVILRVRRDLAFFRETCQAYGGRVVDDRGDGFKMEFESPVQATKAALAMQDETWTRNAAARGEEPRVFHRMGLHFGDVMVVSGEVTGHAVTVAARLEAQAVPGEICYSDDVHRMIKASTNFPRRYIGAQTVKGLTEPIKVWMSMVRQDGYVPPDPTVKERQREILIRQEAVEEYLSDQRERGALTPYLVVIAALLFAAGGIALYYAQPVTPKPSPKKPGKVLPTTERKETPKANRETAPPAGQPEETIDNATFKGFLERRRTYYPSYDFAGYINDVLPEVHGREPKRMVELRAEADHLQQFMGWIREQLHKTENSPLDVSRYPSLQMGTICGMESEDRLYYQSPGSEDKLTMELTSISPADMRSLAEALAAKFGRSRNLSTELKAWKQVEKFGAPTGDPEQ